jgi:hypothetical protein
MLQESNPCIHIHMHDLKPGAKIVWLSYTDEEEIAVAPLRLNHYAIQSYDWFKRVKMTRGDSTSSDLDGFRGAEYFKRYDVNEFSDTELAKKRGYNIL